MMIDDDGQMIFRDLGGLKLLNICLTGEEKPQKNLTQETCPNWGSNPGPLHDRHACYHLAHSGGQDESCIGIYCMAEILWVWRLVSTMSWRRLGGFLKVTERGFGKEVLG